MALALTLLGAPRVAKGQQPKVSRIGFLGLAPASAWAGPVEALRTGLRELGYVEGTNLVIEFRWAARVEQMPELAADLVRMKVDVILAPASTQVEPARRATRTIPIVFAQHADPVGIGHVASLARPGGNVTGVSMALTEMASKALAMLKEAVPHAKRIGVLWNPTTPSHPHVLKAVEATGASLGIELVSAPVRTVEDFDTAFATIVGARVDGFLVPSSPLTNAQRRPLAELARKHRLPGMFVNEANVEAGGLMSYGADFNDMYRRAASYVDKILKGANPADLPVEQPTKFRLVVNLETAKALGIALPHSLLVQADRVIQ